MRPMVSIIVPVYNAEQYLRRCVDSILNQEYTDFEVFLVNDGSTDSSGDICEEYGNKDTRVIVIQKENTGVSDSRNLALDRARGKYLQFLDSDDWITPDATRLFVRAAEEYGCDMVISDFYRVVGERLSPKGDIEEEGVLTQEEFAAHMMENPADFYYGVLWNKLYRRDLVEEHSLRMDTNINWCEDFLFNLEYIRYAKVFYALHAPIYYYVKRKGSLASQGISISKTVKMKLNVFEYYNNFYKHVLEEEDYEKNRLQVYRFFIDAAGDGTVPPSILPGSKKLGDERVFVNTEILQAEGKKAVENLDEILDVPGIDVVFIGPYDLSSALGHVGEIDHPEVVECIKGIIAKASAKGVKLGCFADTVEGGKKWRDLGVKFIGYSCDTYLFMQAAKADVDAFAK